MTGVSAATLRAWERRYGIPSPERTASSYRVYSDEDVALIRKLRALCEGGMAPADAARSLKQAARQEAEPLGTDEDPFDYVSSEILAATEQFSVGELEQATRKAMVMGPATLVWERVFEPALRQIGDRWHEGTLSVAQEHMASHIIESASRDMLRLITPHDSARRIVLACFADEEHVLPLFGFAFRAASWGFAPVILGARTPTTAVANAVKALQPQVVGLSATMRPEPERGRELVEGYAVACARVGWIVGGASAPDLESLVAAGGGEVLDESDPAVIQSRLEAAARRTEQTSTRH